MTKLLTQFRELLFWPFAFAVSPRFLQLKILRYLETSPSFHEEATKSMLVNLPHLLPEADLSQAERTLRRVLLIDAADVFFSIFRSKKTLPYWVTCTSAPERGQATLILSAHRGNGWWLLPQLAAQGEPVHFVIASPSPPTHLSDYFLWPIRHLRWRLLNKIGGTPLVSARGAVQASRDIFSQNGRVLALIDLPSTIARPSYPVPFLSRTAFMPRRLIDTALEAGSSIFYCRSDFNPSDFKVHIEFEKIETHLGAQAVFETYARLLEADICSQPGSWHAWGHVQLFFNDTASSPDMRESA